MNNKYLYMVLGGVFLFAWNWVGHQPHYADGANMSDGWWLVAILMLAMGAGNSDGTCAVTTPVNALKGMINTMISLSVAGLVANLMYQLMIKEGGAYNYMGSVSVISTVVASGVLITITASYLKKASA